VSEHEERTPSDQATLGPAPAQPASAKRRPGPRRVRLVGSLAGVVVAAAVAALALWLAQPSRSGEQASAARIPVAWGRPVVSPEGLVQRSGVKITQVAVSGAGGLVDLRFKVLDPAKAHALHDPRTPPAVIDERTGLVIRRLLMNHAHSGEFKQAVTYYLVFENTGDWIRRGSRVTVLLGNAQVEHVVAE
jgi:hypothetical protein